MELKMKVVIAIDSFKGSLSTFQSGKAVAEAVKLVFPQSSVVINPIADGGEGTVEAIVESNSGKYVKVSVHDPLDRIITAEYGIIPSTNTAVIEMSAAAGITLISPQERNPLNTSTFGVGEMIADAITKSCRNFIIGIGGSATNDGGVGMLEALGFEFLDKHGQPIAHGAKGLKNLAEIRTDKAIRELSECTFSVACDVNNPLCGVQGASAIYGPQKGATPEMISDMDSWLQSYANLTKKIYKSANENSSGAGAAGGLGFALTSYLGARLCSGIDLVMGATGLEYKIKNADIVVTGEGRLDEQSCMGKAPVGVARLAKKYGKTVVAFAGSVTDRAALCNEHGIDAFFSILKSPVSLDMAMNVENAFKNLKNTAEQTFRLVKALTNK